MPEVESLPISISGITKTYDDVYALDDVDLEVKSGEFLTLLGPSGSGKTTLLMTLAGFTRPDCGSIKFGDEVIIALFVSGGENSTLTRNMFNALRDQIDPTIASISTIMVLISSTLLIATQFLGKNAIDTTLLLRRRNGAPCLTFTRSERST